MKDKKMLVLLVVLIAVAVLGAFFKNFFTAQTGGGYRNITDLESAYNAEAEIAQALRQLSSSQDKATIITRSNGGLRQVALTFDGLAERTTIQRILDLLKKYNAKATFFVDGVQTAEDPQTVANIKNEGQRIENYSFSGMVAMERLPAERVVSDFCRTQKIISVTTDQAPKLLKCNSTTYTDQLLQIAKACGFTSVVKSDVFLNVKDISTLATADGFVGAISPGSIVSIQLKPNDEPITNEPGKTDLRPAIDKQPGLKELAAPGMTENEVVGAVEKLLLALNKANYSTAYVEDFPGKNIILQPVQISVLTNSGKPAADASSLWTKAACFLKEQVLALVTCRPAYAAVAINPFYASAQEIKVVSTTEQALSYTFGGLANQTVVNDVLARLSGLGIKATFFVAEVEMQRYPKTLRKIIDNGHEIGIAIRPGDGASLGETQSVIIRSRAVLKEQFGVTTDLVKQPWGVVADTTKQAVFSADCKLIGQSVNVVQSQHKDYTTADQVMAGIFGPSALSLARGQIVHFRMDYYNNDRLVGDLLETIKQRKVDNIAYATSFDNPTGNRANNSQYVIKPIGQVLNNTRFTYQYPVEPATVPLHLRSSQSGLAVDKHNFLEEISKRFIGHTDVNYEDRMLGFSKMDIRRLDTSGMVQTDENVVFLTFDDWGTDAAINKILYVLRKHHVRGTFFVITNNVLYNPNLLRAIAVQGHDIGSHSDQHNPMVARDPKTGRQVQTWTKQQYLQDYSTSYQKLQDVIGDVAVSGKPALTRFFRPPTLAISKIGFEALLETGYQYIIDGSGSTYDYKAENVVQLVRTMKDTIYTKNGEVKKGTILIMHMSDSSAYTAMALDILLTANDAKASSDPSKFKVGRLSDYLTDGYQQINRKNR